MLVIDVQEKFMKAIPRFDDIVDNITKLIMTFQMYNMPIVVTEQYPAGLGATVGRLQGLFRFLEVVEKTEFSATDNPRFWAQVNPLKPNTFVVCGIETHVCINQTVMKLVAGGMQAHVVADATGSRHELDHNVALRRMESAGAHITTTEMCLFELTEKAGTESFKYIQQMVKGKPSPSVPLRPITTIALPVDSEQKPSRGENEPRGPADAGAPNAGAADVGVDSDPGKTPLGEDLIQSIEKIDNFSGNPSGKTEKELTTDLQEIDKLIGTIEKIDGEKNNNSSSNFEVEK